MALIRLVLIEASIISRLVSSSGHRAINPTLLIMQSSLLYVLMIDCIMSSHSWGLVRSPCIAMSSMFWSSNWFAT